MNETILVIQDENVAKMSIKPKLEQLGYSIFTINSKEIKTIINSQKIKPDLILIHITSNWKMNGINIPHDFDIPIIHLADCSNNILEIADLTYDVSYITEPLKDDELKNAIENALYKHYQKLKDNEEKYRLIFENTGIATVIIEENTTICMVNTAFEKLSGYLQEEVEGKKKFEEFISSRQLQEIERYHNLMRIDPKSSPINYKFKFIDRYHEFKEVYSTASMIRGTKRIIISLLDISDENPKRALKSKKEYTPVENSHMLPFKNHNMTSLSPHMVEMSELSKSEILSALLENEEYQKRILSTVQTGIVVIDAETKRIIDINESALKFIGTHRDKVIGNICHKFICPADEGHCPIIDYNHIMDNSERILININNEKIPIIKTVTPISLKGRKCLIESFMDITKLRLTENALRKSEAVLRSFFDSNDVIMSVIELVNDDILYVLPNRHVAEFFGMDINDITGKHLSDLDVPTNFQNFLVKKTRECLKKGTINIEFNFPDKNHERWYHGSISQIKEKSSKKFSFVAIEITETKLIEDKLKASLKEKELLLHEIHHRVKNNLQIISSLLSLQSRYIEDDETLKIFKESQNRVMSLAMIHEKLYKSSNFVQVDFAEYIKDLVDKLFYTYKISPNTVQLNINIDNIVFDIETAIPCGLIINELVTNSLKHAFPQIAGGKSRKNEIQIGLYQAQGSFVLTVSDNGTGLPENVDFTNTTSLGLQLVNSLAHQLDGNIIVDKTRGTNFKIIFKKMKYKKRL